MLKHQLRKYKRLTLSYFYAYTGKFFIRLLLWTCRIEVKGIEQFVSLASKERCILMLWHNRLALVSEILNRYAPQFIYSAFISKSRDGDPLAVLAHSYKIGKVIRVPHDARHQALKKVILSLKNSREIIVITPDGPRGPCYQVKPGIALAAKEADAAIVPFSWTADRYWELKTWDKFRLPKPWSKIVVNIGQPIRTNEEEIQELTHRLQQTLQSID